MLGLFWVVTSEVDSDAVWRVAYVASGGLMALVALLFGMWLVRTADTTQTPGIPERQAFGPRRFAGHALVVVSAAVVARTIIVVL